jgi:hypothetical protein
MTAALVLGSILYACAHLTVQLAVRRVGDVPWWWAVAIAVVDVSPAAILLGLGAWWALPVLVVGVLSVPMAVHVLARRAAVAELARVGQQEVAARTMLRRATPEERRRVLEPRTGSVDLDELATMARAARRGIVEVVHREAGIPPRAA